jgi:hypothetical protein
MIIIENNLQQSKIIDFLELIKIEQMEMFIEIKIFIPISPINFFLNSLYTFNKKLFHLKFLYFLFFLPIITFIHLI